MKQFFVRQLEQALRWIAQAIIRKYRPSVIAVTGSVGKTATKLAIVAALQDARSVRASPGNFNNELGVPLTIIGDWKEISGYFFWIKVIAVGLWSIATRVQYPEVLILEYGIQKPGDMDYLLSIAKPSIAVMTAIGGAPVHMEFFDNAEALAREKEKLLRAVGPMGFVVLNADDDVVWKMREGLHARCITFGCAKRAEIRVVSFDYLETEVKPVGISWKLEYAGSLVPLRFVGILGKPHAYATAAGACVGLIFGLNLVRIAESIQKKYDGPKHRMRIVEGVGETVLIDDSYNASPIAMEAAIEVIEKLHAKRKVGILGDMRELGEQSIELHRAIGRRAGKVFNVLIAVGSERGNIAEGAQSERQQGKIIIEFSSVADAIREVPSLLKPGDLVLIKGSRAIELDRLVDVMCSHGDSNPSFSRERAAS